MTIDEQKMVSDLSRCKFAVGSWDKKFASNLNVMPAEKELTPAQKENLIRVHHKYRKQITANQTM